MSQQSQRRTRPQRYSPESIAVIIAGWPGQQAKNVANACAKRGYHLVPFGFAEANIKETSLSVHEVPELKQPLHLARATDTNAQEQLLKAVDEQRKQNRFVVVVDTTLGETATQNVHMYNQVQVPFVLQIKGTEQHQQAVRETEQARSSALITEQMNRQLSVMDEMWKDWSRHFPGLFDDFDLTFHSSHPRDTPRSLLNSFSDLLNRDFGMEQVQQIQDKPSMEGHLMREYTFKNGSGSSAFTFRQTVNDEQEFADSAVDAVGFLAQKSHEMARPQVYSMLDVARFQIQ
jgi:hypothetical protein